jgi:hypothetical protein
VSGSCRRITSNQRLIHHLSHSYRNSGVARVPRLDKHWACEQPLALNALCCTLRSVTGITNKSLRALMPGLLGEPYSMNRASYDLTRLRRNGLITRVPARNLYTFTDDGLAFAVFYTNIHNRVLRPLFATTPHQPARRRYAQRYAPSISTSAPDSRTHDYPRRPPDTLPNCQSSSDQGSLATKDR